MKQVRIYTRGNQESVMNQINELVSYYDKMEGVIIRNIYADTQPKKGLKQFELEVMLNCLNKGEIILVTSLDRLSRKVSEVREILKKIEEVGAELIVVKQQNPMFNLFMKEISEKMYERTLESTEIENSVRRKIDNPSLERLFDILQEALVNRYDEVNKNEK